jgi:anti-sigma B factor antagonist
MEINFERTENEILAKLSGRLDTATAVEFEKYIAPIAEGNPNRVILDCTEFEYISSTGLRLFLTLQKAIKANSGQLTIRNLNVDIKTVFDMTGFTSLFSFE